MKHISDVIELCDELSSAARRLRSEEIRRAIQQYADAQKEALEAVRKRSGSHQIFLACCN